jgi:hypothetical protein
MHFYTYTNFGKSWVKPIKKSELTYTNFGKSRAIPIQISEEYFFSDFFCGDTNFFRTLLKEHLGMIKAFPKFV